MYMCYLCRFQSRDRRSKHKAERRRAVRRHIALDARDVVVSGGESGGVAETNVRRAAVVGRLLCVY